MPFRVVQPPTAEAEFTEVGKNLCQSGRALGLEMDAEGFLYSWVNGTRVIVEEANGEIIGMLLLAIGKRWTHNDNTASVLRVETPNYDTMIDFTKQIAAALGCSELHVQSREIEEHADRKVYTVTGYKLG